MIGVMHILAQAAAGAAQTPWGTIAALVGAVVVLAKVVEKLGGAVVQRVNGRNGSKRNGGTAQCPIPDHERRLGRLEQQAETYHEQIGELFDEVKAVSATATRIETVLNERLPPKG